MEYCRLHELFVYFIEFIFECFEFFKHSYILLSFLFHIIHLLYIINCENSYDSASLIIVFTFFSALLRTIMNSRPQPSQRSLKSMPERRTIILLLPQGWLFFITRISPFTISILHHFPFLKGEAERILCPYIVIITHFSLYCNSGEGGFIAVQIL